METESTTNQAEMRIDHPETDETDRSAGQVKVIIDKIQMRADSSTMTPPTNLAPGSTSQVTGLEEHKMDLIRLKIKTRDPFI